MKHLFLFFFFVLNKKRKVYIQKKIDSEFVDQPKPNSLKSQYYFRKRSNGNAIDRAKFSIVQVKPTFAESTHFTELEFLYIERDCSSIGAKEE